MNKLIQSLGCGDYDGLIYCYPIYLYAVDNRCKCSLDRNFLKKVERGIAAMCTIDWAATGAMLQGIGTILGAIVVLGVAIVGSCTWQYQKRTERKAMQAERILNATYKAKRGLADVRNPVILVSESNAAEAKLKEHNVYDSLTKDMQSKYCTAQIYSNRLEQTQSNRKELSECQPTALALFGEELVKALKKLDQVFQDVLVAVILERDLGGKRKPNDNFVVDSEKNNRTIWENYPSFEENDVDQTIAIQVKHIEDICSPALRYEDKCGLRWLCCKRD